jgi:predicted Zn-dependent protease with MMP-like domain
MRLSEFEEIVAKALRGVPRRFRAILEREGIPVLARNRVPGPLREKDRLLFGLFVGVPYTERSAFDLEMEPTRIELYRESFEEAFPDRGEMEAEIVKTVIHEIGHYFGFSEQELERHGL